MLNRNSIHHYVLLLAFAFFAFILSLIPIGSCKAEEITLTTYYPSPFGVYSELRLAPKNSATCNASQRGLLYYDDDDDEFRVCAGTPADWVPAGGSFWTLTAPNLYPNDLTWNVGIGIAAPGSKLHVYGGRVEIGSTAENYVPASGNWDYTLLLDSQDTSSIGFHDSMASVSSIRYANDGFRIGFDDGWGVKNTYFGGNVSIGTTASGRRLEINGGGTTHGAAIRFSGQPANTDSAIIELMNPAGTGGAWSIGSRGNSNEVFKIYSNTGASDRFTMNVNDGTTILNPSGGNTQIGFISAPVAPARLSVLGNAAVGNVTFATSNPPAESLIVSGNVGIGTSSPVAKLDVLSSAIAIGGSVPLRLKSTAPQTGTMLFQMGAQADTENTIVSLTSNELASKDFTIAGWNLANVGRIKLLANTVYMPGNVGIGSGMWSPAYQLQLSANSAAKPTSNVWTIVSDRRLKKNIKPIYGALDKMLKLKGRTFEWKEPEKQGNYTGEIMGLIAQEVEEAFPKWIKTNNEGYKDLTVIGFEALTAEAIRELKQKNEALEKRLEALELKVNKE